MSVRRWWIWSVMAGGFLMVYFHRVAPAAMVDRLQVDFALSGGGLGNLSAIYFWVYALMQLPTGLLVDNWGPRRTGTVGLLAAGAGSLLFALAPTGGAALAGRFLVGLGVAVNFLATLKVVGAWFPERQFGLMSGLTVFVGQIGALIGGAPFAVGVGLVGWRAAYAGSGALTAAHGLACWAWVADRPGPAPARAAAVDWRAIGQGVGTVLGNRHSWPPFFGFFGIYGGLLGLSGVWGVPYLMQIYGMARPAAAGYNSLVALGLMVGSPIWGTVSDRLGRRRLPLVLSAAGLCLTWLPLVFGRPPAALIGPLLFAMGLLGSGFSLVWAAAKECNPSPLSGLAMAVANGGLFGPAVLQPVFGLMLDRTWQGATAGGARLYTLAGYQQAFAVGLAATVLATVALVMVRETYCRNTWARQPASVAG